ncbi:MAG: hypothetical protein EA398_00150, partial [Deltaproteobacteria bacterium]
LALFRSVASGAEEEARLASGELRFSFRGPSLQPRFAFSDRLVYEAVDLEETAQHANPVRVGDALRVVVVNHATGYMGTAHTVLGSERGEVPELEVSGGEAGRVEVVLRPPNLRVWAERTWTVSEGGTAGEGRRNVLGTEGSALVTDETLTVYTEWLDADGTALPMGLPGFTGRLARVIGEVDEDNPAMGRLLPVGDGSGADEDEDEHVGMFEIRPGRQTQVLQLPREDAARRSHFYVHVSGTSLQEGARGGTGREPGPSFAVNVVCFHGRGSGSGSMRCGLRAVSGVGEEGETPWMGERPMRLVPVLTPKHNAVLTLARRQAALALGQEDPGPVIEWVYRPEAHFTLLELESLQVGRRTAGGLDVPMLGDDAAEGDATFRGDDQWLWGDFGWEGPEEEEDLGRFSGDRALGMYIGDTEGATDADGRWIFLPEQLGSLDADDYATLRVAQRGDEGNTLWEFAFEVERLELVRRYHRPVFDGGHPQPHLDVPVDDYRILEVVLHEDARVAARIVGEVVNAQGAVQQVDRSLLRAPGNPSLSQEETTLPPGTWRIPLTYGEVEAALEELGAGPEFTVEIHRLPAEASSEPLVVLARLDGVLVEQRTGLPAGQAQVQGVRLHDGAYQTQRTDFVMPSRGVPVIIGRTYDNTRNVEGSLGPGWEPTFEHFARPLVQVESAGESGGAPDFTVHPVPSWVARAQGGFTPAAELSPSADPVLSLLVMDTTFVWHDGAWHPERGRHDRLEVVGGAGQPADAMVEAVDLPCGDEGCLRMTTPEGERFWFRMPRTMVLDAVQADGVFALRDVQPQAEPLLLTADRHGNATRYRTFVGRAEDSPDGECVSSRVPNRLCRIEFDLRPTDEQPTMAAGRTCRFGYARVEGLETPNPHRLVSVTCGAAEAWEGPPAEDVVITYAYDSAAGHLAQASRDSQVETYDYSPAVQSPSVRVPHNLREVVGPAQERLALTYDAVGALIEFSEEDVDAGLRPEQVVTGITRGDDVPGGTSAHGCPGASTPEQTWALVYAGLNRTVTDPLGQQTQWALNPIGNPRQVDGPGGEVIREWTLDDWSALESTVDNVLGAVELRHATFETPRRTENAYLPDRRGFLGAQKDALGG